MKILIATNHSYMFYRFRKELVEALMQEHEVILSTPFVGHEDDLQAMRTICRPWGCAASRRILTAAASTPSRI